MRERSVLVATDFSADAQRAAERAARLGAAGVFARGRLLHVIQQSWIDSLRRLLDLPAEREQELLAATGARLHQVAHTLAERFGFEFEAGARIGSVDQLVREEAARATLLVLGARGCHPLRDFAIGTTAEHLLRRTHTPLLVVRREAAADYRNVLVATDFSAHAARALALACMVAPAATIHLRHIYEVPFEGMLQFAGLGDEKIEEYRRRAHADALEQMHRFVAASGVDPARLHATVSSAEHIPSALHEVSRAIGADLVVVGKHGKNLAEDLLLGSVTLHLLAESTCDVLVAM